MIPKRIHYCWFSGEPMPPLLRRCVESWRRVLPDYELCCWTAREFDVGTNPFVAEAFRARRWAFVTDYARLHALHECGGIFLDTDVEVRRPFDEFLDARVFTAVEYHYQLVLSAGTRSRLDRDGRSLEPGTPKPGIGLQAAVMAGEAGHPFLRDCMRYYEDRHFLLANGEQYDQVIAPDIYAMVAERYGFRYRDQRQELRDGMRILPSEVFAGTSYQTTRRSYAVHYGAGGWRPPERTGPVRAAARRVSDALGLRGLWHRWRAARTRL